MTGLTSNQRKDLKISESAEANWNTRIGGPPWVMVCHHCKAYLVGLEDIIRQDGECATCGRDMIPWKDLDDQMKSIIRLEGEGADVGKDQLEQKLFNPLARRVA